MTPFANRKPPGLAEAIQSIIDYLAKTDVTDAVLDDHSYGGMIITVVADIVPEHIRRPVCWNALSPMTIVGGPGRTRTCNQTVMSELAPSKISDESDN